MLVSIIGILGTINFIYGTVTFITDPYAMYEVARNIRASLQRIESSPMILDETISGDEWSVVEDWEMIETKFFLS